MLRSFEQQDGLRYYAFPQKGATTAFLKDAKIEFENSELVVSEQKGEESQLFLFGKNLQFQAKGVFQKHNQGWHGLLSLHFSLIVLFVQSFERLNREL